MTHGGFQAGSEDNSITFFGLDGGDETNQLDWLLDKGNRGCGFYPDPPAMLAVGASDVGTLVFVGVGERRGEFFLGKDMDGGGAKDPENADNPTAVRWNNVERVARDVDDFLERLEVETAAEEGDVEAIKIYLTNGHDVNATVLTTTLLEEAIFGDQVELIRWLYERGANATSAGMTSWCLPMEDAERRATLDAFMSGVTDVNAFGSDGEGNSMLFRAMLCGNLDLARELLARGARIGQDVRRLAAYQVTKGSGVAQALLDKWDAATGR